MALANYQYTSDASNLYQVTLPTDFANALGMTTATGSEPYLDAAIAPRYATYRSNSGLLRAAVVGTTAIFSSLPATLTVAGVTYNFLSAVGESIPPIPFQPWLSPSGVQGAPGPTGAQGPAGPTGPQGPPGVSSWNEITLGSSVSIGTSDTVVLSTGAIADGTYLVIAVLNWLNGSSGEQLNMSLKANYAISNQLTDNAQLSATSQTVLCAVIAANGGYDFEIHASKNTGSATAQSSATRIIYLQLD